MSVYKETYMAATATAEVATAMILRPWALYVVAAIGTMISDPEGMAESAGGWRTDELVTLGEQLDQLKTQLQEQGTWEGSAFDAFETVHTSFKNSINDLNEARNNTGDAVDSAAGFYRVGAIVCSAVAGAMLAFGIWKMFMRSNPATAVTAEVVDVAVGRAATSTIGTVVKRHAMVAGGMAMVLAAVVQQSKMTGKIFPTLEAMPTAMTSGGSTFTSDGMTYEEDMGALTPKMDDSVAETGGFPV
ncbi:WXG100 family type VII secretion target [Nonomuraea turkmeniaca]|uniref:WXG100 family type VII secretion target n=1 Tax=Nonomuraea turkmeniaca TaxID=103838 RepID=A0A5S4EVE5_9ACTN|nr:WXG100 family type VII secretion target [Nonomuraea turkmeniaca]TMR06651.1 WXG100 family type VII secretion target [Nonomuraea turkmeniaca]